MHNWSCKLRGLRIHTADKYLFLLLTLLILLATDSFLQSYQYEKRKAKNNYSVEITAQLASALRELDLMKYQNEQLFQIFEQVSQRKPQNEKEKDELLAQLLKSFKNVQKLLNTNNFKSIDETSDNKRFAIIEKPSTNYEMTRRSIENDVHELWYYFGSQIKKLKNLTQAHPEISTHLIQITENGLDHKRNLLRSTQNLASHDGYQRWREQEARDLSELVQKRLYRLQNPKNCSASRKLLCQVKKICGYACQINHIFYCLVEAYGAQRTMILESEIWTKYEPSNWTKAFFPVTNCSYDGEAVTMWPGTVNSSIIRMTYIESLRPKPQHLPLGIPRDIASRLARLHADPAVWWVGQFWQYILRPQPVLTRIINERAEKIKFQKPIVGLHIRRTDKLDTEAAFHPLDEYMQAVEEYYTQLELSQNVEKRRIFIASDDASVFEEARTKYPAYEIIGDPNVAVAASLMTRYVNNALYNIITDIHFLAQSDFIVCTFSSGVCRQAYEIMQTLHTDASFKYRSLDDIYYSSGQVLPRSREVIYEHRSQRPEEIDLNVGDIVHVAGNHWDGYSLGTNTRTNKKGLYPSHKVIEKLDIVDFSTFNELD